MKIEINIPDTETTAKGLIAVLRRIEPSSKFESEKTGEELIIQMIEIITDYAFDIADPETIEKRKKLREENQRIIKETVAKREELKKK